MKIPCTTGKFVNIDEQSTITNPTVQNGFVWFCQRLITGSEKEKDPEKNYKESLYALARQYDFNDAQWYLFDVLIDKFSENKFKAVTVNNLEYVVYWWKNSPYPLFILKSKLP